MDTTPTPPRPGSVQQFAWIMKGVLRGLGARSDRMHPELLLPGPFLALVWNRLSRLANRFNRLVQQIEAQIQAGTPPRPPRRRPAAPRPSRSLPPPDPAMRVPRARGWLVRLGKHDAAGAGSLLRVLFAEPEMSALLQADPRRMGRILRPLCWALDVTPPSIINKPLPRPRAAPAAAPSGDGAGPVPRTSPPDPAAPAPSRPSRRARAPQRPRPTACGPPPVSA